MKKTRLLFGLAMTLVTTLAFDARSAEPNIESLLASAKAGDVSDAAMVGACYEEGRCGAAMDHGEAMRWYRIAAAKGDVWAMYGIGTLYHHGRGVSKDKAIALAIYEVVGALSAKSVEGMRDHQESLTRGMSESEVYKLGEISNPLYLQMREPGNFIRALDQYLAEHRGK